MSLHESSSATLFPLGRREITPAAQAALSHLAIDPDSLFARHAAGDWGQSNDWMRGANDEAVRQGPSTHVITSRYPLADGLTALVVTGMGRTETLLLLESERQYREVSLLEGYAAWAAHYDAIPNALIMVEEPVALGLLDSLPSPRTAADIGAGTGRWSLRLARRGCAVTAFDQSPEMLSVARRAASEAGLSDINFVQANLESAPLPAPSGAFDLVVSGLMLSHITDLRGVVAECLRLLRPGGHFLATDFHPAAVAWGWRTAFEEPGTTYRLPNPGHRRADYLSAIEAAGGTVTDIHDIALDGESYGDCSPEAVRERGWPPLGFVILAQKR